MTKRPKTVSGTKFIITAILFGFGVEIYTGALTNGDKLAWLGAVVRPLIFEYGQYWRLVSAMFLHGNGTLVGGIVHLLVNLLAIFQIGTLFEVMFGTRRYLFIYFTTGIVASLTSAFVHGGPSVGASGAIYGILGAFVITVWRSPHWRHHRNARSIVNQLVFWIIFNLLVSAGIPQIDMSAHLGGLLAGALLAMILPRHAPPPPKPSAAIIDVMPYDD